MSSKPVITKPKKQGSFLAGVGTGLLGLISAPIVTWLTSAALCIDASKDIALGLSLFALGNIIPIFPIIAIGSGLYEAYKGFNLGRKLGFSKGISKLMEEMPITEKFKTKEEDPLERASLKDQSQNLSTEQSVDPESRRLYTKSQQMQSDRSLTFARTAERATAGSLVQEAASLGAHVRTVAPISQEETSALKALEQYVWNNREKYKDCRVFQDPSSQQLCFSGPPEKVCALAKQWRGLCPEVSPAYNILIAGKTAEEIMPLVNIAKDKEKRFFVEGIQVGSGKLEKITDFKPPLDPKSSAPLDIQRKKPPRGFI